MSNPSKDSYSEILRSSSIIGGARAINLVIGLVRTKVVAVLLGPSGIGLISLYQSAMALTGMISGLGIVPSGVRQVAEAKGLGDQDRIGRTVRILWRTCWLTGFLGVILSAALARPISEWIFGNTERAWLVGLLGLTLLMGSISGGQSAVIQGMRRIGDLARLNIFSAITGTLISVGFYSFMGEQGIVPVLLIMAAVNMIISLWMVKRVSIPYAKITWRETIGETWNLISLGLAFMWSGLLLAGFDLGARGLITQGYGTEGNGIYQAAWAISGVFAGFILEAMGADFYPRLTAVANDNEQINKIVNEQTEIGILLALPGLLTTLVLSEWIIRIFYTTEFGEAASLLQWFVLGIFGKVISWPLGFIQLAKGASLCFAVTETVAVGIHFIMVLVGLKWLGLSGVAIAFAVLYGLYTIGMLVVAFRLTRFHWCKEVFELFSIAVVLIFITFLLVRLAPECILRIIGAGIVAGTSLYCLRQLTIRLGTDHRICKMILRIPLVGERIAK